MNTFINVVQGNKPGTLIYLIKYGAIIKKTAQISIQFVHIPLRICSTISLSTNIQGFLVYFYIYVYFYDYTQQLKSPCSNLGTAGIRFYKNQDIVEPLFMRRFKLKISGSTQSTWLNYVSLFAKSNPCLDNTKFTKKFTVLK